MVSEYITCPNCWGYQEYDNPINEKECKELTK